MDKMNKIWMLLLVLAVSTFFIHVPHVGKVGFILNPEVTLSYNQYFCVFSVCVSVLCLLLLLLK